MLVRVEGDSGMGLMPTLLRGSQSYKLWEKSLQMGRIWCVFEKETQS